MVRKGAIEEVKLLKILPAFDIWTHPLYVLLPCTFL